MDLSKANKGLDRVRIIEREGYKNLYLRAFLPNKAGDGISRQTINTKCRATPAGATVARALAKKLDSELALNKFRWEGWGYSKPVAKSSLEEFIEQKRSQINESSFNSQYVGVLKHIDESKMSADYFVALIREKSSDHTKNRKVWCMVLAQLARFLEMDDTRIKAIAGSYRPKAVDPAALPDDTEKIGRAHV